MSKKGKNSMKITAAQTSPSFQKLYMPSKEENTKKVGAYFANEIEKARPMLEKLAEKTDVFVQPQKTKSNDYFAFCRIGVMKASENFKDRLSNFGKRFEETIKLVNLPIFDKIATEKGEDLKPRNTNQTRLTETVENLKSDLNAQK